MNFLVCDGHLGYDPILTHFRESDFGRLFFSQSLDQLKQETVEKPFVRICLASEGILTRQLMEQRIHYSSIGQHLKYVAAVCCAQACTTPTNSNGFPVPCILT